MAKTPRRPPANSQKAILGVAAKLSDAFSGEDDCPDAAPMPPAVRDAILAAPESADSPEILAAIARVTDAAARNNAAILADRAAERRAASEVARESKWETSDAPQRHSRRELAELMRAPRWARAWERLRGLLGRPGGTLTAVIGPRGVGKTQFGTEAIRHYCLNLGRHGRYVKAVSFFAELRATWKPKGPETEEKVLNRFSRVPLLVIDALEERSEFEWEGRMLTEVLDDRYLGERDTLLFSNHTLEGFERAMGESVMSRIDETGTIIVCDWASFRQKGGA